MRKIEEICNDIKELTSKYMWMVGEESYQRNCLLQEIIDVVNSNTNWILCKDRLPTKTDCLHYDDLTMEHFDCFWVTMLQNNCGLTYSTRMCYRPERNLWYRNGSDMSGVDASKIIAWMPLVVPNPYKINEVN